MRTGKIRGTVDFLPANNRPGESVGWFLAAVPLLVMAPLAAGGNCPAEIDGAALQNPLIVSAAQSPVPAFELAPGQHAIVQPGAVVRSRFQAFDNPGPGFGLGGAYSTGGPAMNWLVVCGELGAAPEVGDPGGGARLGPGARVLVAGGGRIRGNRGGSTTAPAIELTGPDSRVEVAQGGELAGSLSQGIRAVAPVTVVNNGSIATASVEGFATPAIGLTNAVGSLIQNTGTISSQFWAAIQFQNGEGAPGSTTRIENSGTISGFIRNGAVIFPPLDLRRGLAEVSNASGGSIHGIGVDPTPLTPGEAPNSGLSISNQPGASIGRIQVLTNTDLSTLEFPYALTIDNAAGATIGTIALPAAVGSAVPETAIAHRTSGPARLQNAGTVEGGKNGFVFNSGDTDIVNGAGGTIRTAATSFGLPLDSEFYGVFGAPTSAVGAARPRIENRGTISGLLGGVNVKSVANVTNRSRLDGNGVVVGGGTITGESSGVTIAGGSVVNEAGATISTSNNQETTIGCIETPDDETLACELIDKPVFFTDRESTGSIDNAGQVTSRRRVAVFAMGSLAFQNRQGGVVRSNEGIAVDARRGLAGPFTNDGSIMGGALGARIIGVSGTSLGHGISNTGSIAVGDPSAEALRITGGTADVLNASSGTVGGHIALLGSRRVPNELLRPAPISGSITNAGVITGSVVFQDGGEVVNQAGAQINGTAPYFADFRLESSGVRLLGSDRDTLLRVSNAGTIMGNNDGILHQGGGGFGGLRVDVTNHPGGRIAGGGIDATGPDDGILADGLALTNSLGASIVGGRRGVTSGVLSRFENMGSITGGDDGVAIFEFVRPPPRGTRVLRNTGAITGNRRRALDVAILQSTDIDNAGQIVAGTDAIFVNGQRAVTLLVNNTGQIRANTVPTAAGTAIQSSTQLTINNAAGGEIEAQNAGGIAKSSWELTIDNTGRMRVTSGQQNNNFALLGNVVVRVTNRAGGEISALTPTALLLGGDPDTTFVIDNAGILTGILRLRDLADSVTNAGTLDGSLEGAGGADVALNPGSISGSVDLGAGDDRLDVTASGTIAGASSGGAGVDVLRIDTATAASRSIAQSAFVQFEQIELNPTAAANGRFEVGPAAAPATQATLDAGATGSAVTLSRGELNLRDTASSVRGAAVATSVGTLLSGNGSVFGNAAVAGAMAAGNGGAGQLSVSGNLALSAGAQLRFDLGAANVVGGTLNDLVVAGGSLVLDGTLVVSQTAGGTFAPGTYRLINYTGGLAALTDNGLEIQGSLPNGVVATVQTSVPNQVNLVVAPGVGVDISHWDGPNFASNGQVDGGTAIWNAANTNWTIASGSQNAPWDSDVGTFAGASGLVTVVGAQAFVGLNFEVGGYRLVPGSAGALSLGNGGFIRVDPGLDATIEAPIGGTGALSKEGTGRLVLAGPGAFVAGTIVNAGTLAIARGEALATGRVTLADATRLQAFNDALTMPNPIALQGPGSNSATVDTQEFTFTSSGSLSGMGRLAKSGAGTLVLTTGGSLGGFDLRSGTLRIEGPGNLGLGAGASMSTSTTVDLRIGSILATGNGGVVGASGGQVVLNAGAVDGAIDLRDGPDRLELASTGTVSGGSAGGPDNDILRIDTAANAARLIAPAAFTGFEDIVLNPSPNASGRFVIGPVSGQGVTLDAGAVGSSLVLARGELNIRDANSTVRAATVGTAASTLLSGVGTIVGDTSVDGAISPGNSGPGPISVMGSLALAPTALLRFELGAADVVGGPLNDLVNVDGGLTLDGAVQVTESAGGKFAPGTYRLINYTGGLPALVDNGLSILGTLPNGVSATVQTSVPNQVNLVVERTSTAAPTPIPTRRSSLLLIVAGMLVLGLMRLSRRPRT